MSNRYPAGTETALNFSSLKHIIKSPRHFQLALTTEFEETIAMRMGTMVHDWILLGKEPEYVIQPADMDGDPWHGNKSWCRAWKREQTLPILTKDEAAQQTAMLRALSGHYQVSKILEGSAKEIALYSEIDGVAFRGIPDAQKEFQIIDLKTCADASPEAFAKNAYNFHYDLQMEIYRNLAGICLEKFTGTWIAVEKSSAVVAVYHMGADFIISGIEKLRKCLDTYRECLALYGDPRGANEWPGYSDSVIINPPKWAK